MLEEVAIDTRGPEHEAQRALLMDEFPSIRVVAAKEAVAPDITAAEWADPHFDAWKFDVAIDARATAAFTLHLRDDAGDGSFPLQVVNRCQRHIQRHNRHSRNRLFERVLREHRKLHDLEKPLVRADYNHSLDVWQWVLRLDADASCAVQIAALFHDIERLASEPDVRVEHLASDYQQFKDAHARAGAEMTRETLRHAGVAAGAVERITSVVASHEQRSDDDDEVSLLNDADALSFFCLNSHGYASYFGPEQTKKKVIYTWNRMSAAARARLATVRVTDEIRQTLNELSAASASARS